MSADVVEGLDLPLSVFGQKEIKPGHFVAQEAAGLRQPSLVRHEKPMSREDRPALELIKCWLGVPGRRERTLQDFTCWFLAVLRPICVKRIGLATVKRTFNGCRHDLELCAIQLGSMAVFWR